MSADHVGGTAREGGNPVQVEGRGIAGEDRAFLHHLVELSEDALLHCQILEDRLDHDVRLGDVRIRESRLKERHPLADLRGGELSLLRARLVVLADGAEPLVEGLLLHFQHAHRDARVGEAHGDAAAHGTGADHGRGVDRSGSRVVGYVRHLRGGTLGQERVPQGLRFRRIQQLDEEAPFDQRSLFERLEGGGDRVDALERRRIPLGHRGDAVARELQERLGIWMGDAALAHDRKRPSRGDAVREGDRAGEEVTLDHLVEEAGLGQHRRRHRGAGDDQVERGLQAEHARNPLRPAGAGNQADLHLRQRDLRRRRGDAIVAAQGELEAAAHRHPVDGGDDRLLAPLDLADHREEVGLLQRFRRAQLVDVCAGGEGLAGACQDDRRDRRIGGGAVEPRDDCGAHRVCEAVDRRIVQSDHRHCALRRVARSAHVPSTCALAATNCSRWCAVSPSAISSAVSRRKRWLTAISSVTPIPPWSCTASWPT